MPGYMREATHDSAKTTTIIVGIESWFPVISDFPRNALDFCNLLNQVAKGIITG